MKMNTWLRRFMASGLCACLLLQGLPSFAAETEQDQMLNADAGVAQFVEEESPEDAWQADGESALTDAADSAKIDFFAEKKMTAGGELESRTFGEFFPDPIFADWIAQEFGRSIDDTVTTEELAQIKSLHTKGMNEVDSIDGIGWLVNIEQIMVYDISSLPDELCTLKHLKYLEVWGEKLSALPERIGDLKQLENLNLGGEKLTTIPDSLFDLENLTSLALHFGEISVLPDKFGQLKRLSYLNLSSNKLTTIPASIFSLVNLQSLELSSNQITVLPSEIGQLTNLWSLNLRDNLLTELPITIGKLTKLSYLDLDNNQIEEIPESISELVVLKKLNISNNRLSTLPDGLAGLTQLDTLVLDKNKLTSLPDQIGNLQSLTVLNAKENQIAVISDGIGLAKKLISLDLSHNQLTDIPNAVGKLEYLRWFNLSNNQISTVSIQENNMRYLKSLYLSDNELTTIPEGLYRFRSISYITLENNKITEIPDQISELNNLTHLNLKRNQIEKISSKISYLPYLEILELTDNKLQSVPSSLATIGSYKSFRKIDLSGNQLAEVPEELVAKMKNRSMKVELRRQSRTIEAPFAVTTETLTLQSVLPTLVWQLYELHPDFHEAVDSYGEKCVTGSILTKNRADGSEVTLTIAEVFSDHTTVNALFPKPGSYDVLYKTDSGSWMYDDNPKSQTFSYAVNLTEPFNLGKVFSGVAASAKGYYTISMSGQIPFDLEEGKNILTPEQLLSLNIRGIAVNQQNDADIGNINQNRITGAAVTVENGRIIEVVINGTAKTATQKVDAFSMKIPGESFIGNQFALMGKSANGTYRVTLNAILPQNLQEGKNSFLVTDLPNLKIFGMLYAEGSGENRILNANSAITSIEVTVEGGVVREVICRGKSKTPNAPLDTYVLTGVLNEDIN